MAKTSDETREHALRLLRDGLPYRQIAEQTGLGLATLSKIARDNGIESERAAQTAAAAKAAGEAQTRRWAERRGQLVDDLGVVAAELLEKARDAPARDAQAFMTAVAIGVDKAQLLSGGVTSRHEQMNADRARERIAEITDELESRRAAKEAATGG